MKLSVAILSNSLKKNWTTNGAVRREMEGKEEMLWAQGAHQLSHTLPPAGYPSARFNNSGE